MLLGIACAGSPAQAIDTLGVESEPPPAPALNAWGLNIMLSDGGFGFGGFYRREFNDDLSGFVDFSISESKETRENERYDPYTLVSYVPGKLNRFIVMPLVAGVQYRLFRESIMDNFRPYLHAAAGPSMIFVAPFVDIGGPPGAVTVRQVEFFSSLGRGRPHYTASAFIGAGANFGSDKSNLFGMNFRYYFTHLFGEGLPSQYDERTGEVVGRKNSFGGFYLTLNVGVVF